MKTLLLFFILPLAACSHSPDPGKQGATMTPKQFQHILSLPGDGVPLSPPLASVPLWTNAVVSNVMVFASGKVFQETMKGTAHTVAGKYVVCALDSKFYQQTMYSIVTCDAGTSAVKTYGLYGNGAGGTMVEEGAMVYDLTNRTYTATSAYGKITETTKGRYNDVEDVSHAIIYKDGALYMTRDTTAWPVH